MNKPKVFNLRVDHDQNPDLWSKVLKSKKESGRSINRELEHLIKLGLKAEGK